MHSMEHYAAIRMNERLPFVTTGMDREGIMMSKISLMEKDKNHVSSLMWDMKQSNKQTKTDSQTSTAWRLPGEKGKDKEGKGGKHLVGEETGRGGEHSAARSRWAAEMCTWALRNVINQRDPNTFNLKILRFRKIEYIITS